MVKVMSMLNGFSKFLFTVFTVLFFVPLAYLQLPYGMFANCALGLGVSALFVGLLFCLDFSFGRTSLKSFNTIALGLFFGWVFAQILTLVLRSLFGAVGLLISEGATNFLLGSLYLLALYFGVAFTARAAEEIHFSIPFLRLKPKTQEKKDLILDTSVLMDPRMIDLVATGLLDHHLILPRFVIKQVHEMAESPSEQRKAKAKQAIELLKKMEQTADLELRIQEADFPDLKDIPSKLIRLARLLEANLFTADLHAFEIGAGDGIKIINLNALAKALKPLTQSGEYIDVKIQRYGKEARQGVGYQEDGTMVVINGGAEFIGETIRAQVLSVKHTSAGRMIFCNAITAAGEESFGQELENAAKPYFAL